MLTNRVPVRAIHHFAYKCRNAEETLHFYEEVLGLPLALVVQEDDVVTTTGEKLSFAHFFFEMKDGNYIAFFDFGDESPAVKDPRNAAIRQPPGLPSGWRRSSMKAKANLRSRWSPGSGTAGA